MKSPQGKHVMLMDGQQYSSVFNAYGVSSYPTLLLYCPLRRATYQYMGDKTANKIHEVCDDIEAAVLQKVLIPWTTKPKIIHIGH